MRKEIFRARVGSHLYGLSTPESDEDFISVFIPSSEDLLGLKRGPDRIDYSTSGPNKKNTSEDTDHVSYSIMKYVGMLASNNPNIIETIFAVKENCLTRDPIFEEIVDNFDKLLCRRSVTSFLEYARSQKNEVVDASEFRGKPAFHSIRLLHNFIELLETGTINFPLTGEIADKGRLLKTGGASKEEYLSIFSDYYQRCAETISEQSSRLPEEANMVWVEWFLNKTLRKHIILENE